MENPLTQLTRHTPPTTTDSTRTTEKIKMTYHDIIRHNILLNKHVMLYHVMLWHVMEYNNVRSWFVIVCNVVPCHFMLCLVILCHCMSFLFYRWSCWYRWDTRIVQSVENYRFADQFL